MRMTNDSVTSYAINGGADQAVFSIDGSSGALTFNAAPDYETPADADENNVYVVVVTATSGVGSRELTAVRTITVTVTDVDESMPAAPPAFGAAGAELGQFFQHDESGRAHLGLQRQRRNGVGISGQAAEPFRK